MGLKDDLIAKSKMKEEAKHPKASVEQETPVEPEPQTNVDVNNADVSLDDLFENEAENKNENSGFEQIPEPAAPIEETESSSEELGVQEVMNDVSYSDYSGTSGSEELKDKLLLLAQRTVLKDVQANFESKLLSKEALEELVDSYLEDREFSYENRNPILISLIEEVKASDYVHQHYKTVLNEIFDSVINGLK